MTNKCYNNEHCYKNEHCMDWIRYINEDYKQCIGNIRKYDFKNSIKKSKSKCDEFRRKRIASIQKRFNLDNTNIEWVDYGDQKRFNRKWT